MAETLALRGTALKRDRWEQMDRKKPAEPQVTALPLRPEDIDALMRAPVKDQPSVMVFGDDAVSGFDPPKPNLTRTP